MRTRIEDLYTPLSITESSTTPFSSTETFLLVCNDNAKLRMINAETKLCRKVLSLPQTMYEFKVIINKFTLYLKDFLALNISIT